MSNTIMELQENWRPQAGIKNVRKYNEHQLQKQHESTL